jgi:hypothetical protein
MTRYVQHISGQGEKWELMRDCEREAWTESDQQQLRESTRIPGLRTDLEEQREDDEAEDPAG